MQNTPIVFRNSVGSGTWVTRFRTSLLKKGFRNSVLAFLKRIALLGTKKEKRRSEQL
jgi:hypothetical protein